MTQRYLSKSDFKIARDCQTKLFYKKSGYPSKLDSDPFMELLQDGGFMVEKMAKLLFPDGIEIDFDRNTEAAAERTLKALSGNVDVTLFEATFIHGPYSARVDILRKRGNDIELIEVKSTSYDGKQDAEFRTAGKPNVFWQRKGKGLDSGWAEYLEDVAFQTMVVEGALPGSKVLPCLMMPDKAKSTAIDRLVSLFSLNEVPNGRFNHFVVDFHGDIDALRQDHFLSIVPVGKEVELLKAEMALSAQTFANSLRPNLVKIPPVLTTACKDCEFRAQTLGDPDGYRECWGKLADPAPHLLELHQVSRAGYPQGSVAEQLIGQGKTSLFDVPPAALVGSSGAPGALDDRRLIQIEYTRRNEEWMSDELPGILAGFKYPLHFIDFETSALAIPYHAGMRPYEEIAFQWSSHTIEAKGVEPVHREWINDRYDFPNFEFAESLMEAVGDAGTIFIYSPHENTYLRAIHRQMESRGYRNPALKAWLEYTVRFEKDDGRLEDMHDLVKKHYFHPRMKGRTSLKLISDAIWSENKSLQDRFPEYLKLVDGALVSPYASLGGRVILDEEVSVKEGTGAIRAYQRMLHGNAEVTEAYKALLLQYCKLDTLAMVMLWYHWTERLR